MTIALHISSRKAVQRWPAEHFAALIRRLHARYSCQLVLFWSPGDERNRMHPGDDGKAAAILSATQDLPLLPYPTNRLATLIGGLSVCDLMVCSDGGAMHVAAGLGLPIVCFFGDSVAEIWHPWGVPYELLQPPGRDVSEISVDDAEAACGRLICRGKAEKQAGP
jgi:ADP-heptose:LPS heptosyltransferase